MYIVYLFIWVSTIDQCLQNFYWEQRVYWCTFHQGNVWLIETFLHNQPYIYSRKIHGNLFRFFLEIYLSIWLALHSPTRTGHIYISQPSQDNNQMFKCKILQQMEEEVEIFWMWLYHKRLVSKIIVQLFSHNDKLCHGSVPVCVTRITVDLSVLMTVDLYSTYPQ